MKTREAAVFIPEIRTTVNGLTVPESQEVSLVFRCMDADVTPKYFPTVLALVLAGATGCSTMTAGQCLNASWYDQGYAAGLSGLPASDLIQQQNACVHYGVSPNHRAYATGWQEGRAAAGQAQTVAGN